MNEDELFRRAREIDEYPTWCLFWPTGLFYGQGKWLKKYGFYPQWLPLPVWTDHSGPYVGDDIANPDKNEIKAPYILKMAESETKKISEIHNIPCEQILSPFVYYRYTNNIKINKNAKGTVVFPTHSTKIVDAQFDEKKYIDMLYELPEQYHPITICMFYMDILQNKHKEFMKYFHVTTCGQREDNKFIERFYEILREHRYVTSNKIGSYTFYAVELGMPFFWYGPSYEIISKNIGKVTHDSSYMRYAKELFSTKMDKPTRQQVDLVKKELGVKDTISRLRAAYILYKSLLQFLWWKVKRKLIHRNKVNDLPSLLS